MDARRAPDWQAVLGVLAGIASVEDLDSFGPRVLAELAEVIPYTVGSFNEIDPLAHRARFDSHPPEAKSHNEAAAAAFPRLVHQHPVAMYQQRTGDGSARRLSEFLDQDALHRLELYTEVFGPIGIEYQVAIGLPARRPLVIGIALGRDDRDFDDDELAVLDALRPHLIQSYRSLQLTAEYRAALDGLAGALESESRAVLVLTPDGAVSATHGPADKLLPAYFDANGAGTLPVRLAQWVSGETAAPPDRLHEPLVVQGPGRRLVARLVRGPGSSPSVIVLDERRTEADAGPLRELGLTSREAEALWLLTRGATTAEIATSLGVAPATVKKHLERVYRKLGVSSRTGGGGPGLRRPDLALTPVRMKGGTATGR